MSHERLRTARLELVPHSPELWRALLESADAFRQLFGASLAEGLWDFTASGEISRDFLERVRTAKGADPWQWGYLVLNPAHGLVIGLAGFKGPPDPSGAVEISYGIAPGYQGQGFATETARALIEFAWASPQVRLVRAHTLPAANASTGVLRKCGLRHLGEVIDPEDGPVWRWELERPA